MKKWREWIEQEIGGPEPAIEAAMGAVFQALSYPSGCGYANQEQVAAEARKAAAPWKQAQGAITPSAQVPARTKGHMVGIIICSIVFLITTFSVLILSQHGFRCANGGCLLLALIIVVDVVAIVKLVSLLRS
jgi:hypothetical protein